MKNIEKKEVSFYHVCGRKQVLATEDKRKSTRNSN
jgi:hypothetical protein